ncbi:PREDICTED: uncharacterized protein LOC109129538 [Camelina sativa]|uniref:Uncharacterized protein LOC109129538 n=1 Tax=Camelina sativa TaxID=90675 RepID=A0ABM1R2X6_CAMSA|nr:PREDICTED: uncharacterized protein LOC109129538 [Camelina sativa]
MASTPDPRQGTSELESHVVAETPQTTESADQREARRDREMTALWEMVQSLNAHVQALTLTRSNTPPGFTTPTTGALPQTPAAASGSGEQNMAPFSSTIPVRTTVGGSGGGEILRRGRCGGGDGSGGGAAAVSVSEV